MPDDTRHTRQSPRHRFRHVLQVIDDNTDTLLGHVGNASPEGLLLVGKEEVPQGRRRRLRIEVPLEEGDSDELILDGISRWSKQVTEPDGWLTGFNIEDSPLNSRMLLASLIHDDF